MDHVFDIEGWWARVQPVDAFGPHIEWREYSFFENTRLTKAVNDSRLVVQPCASGACPGGVKATGIKVGGRSLYWA